MFFNDTATPEIYTLSLHDALRISVRRQQGDGGEHQRCGLAHGQDVGVRAEVPDRLQDVVDVLVQPEAARRQDRKSTRLNSSHANISYAVFCLKKKTIISSSP